MIQWLKQFLNLPRLTWYVVLLWAVVILVGLPLFGPFIEKAVEHGLGPSASPWQHALLFLIIAVVLVAVAAVVAVPLFVLLL